MAAAGGLRTMPEVEPGWGSLPSAGTPCFRWHWSPALVQLSHVVAFPTQAAAGSDVADRRGESVVALGGMEGRAAADARAGSAHERRRGTAGEQHRRQRCCGSLGWRVLLGVRVEGRRVRLKQPAGWTSALWRAPPPPPCSWGVQGWLALLLSPEVVAGWLATALRQREPRQCTGRGALFWRLHAGGAPGGGGRQSTLLFYIHHVCMHYGITHQCQRRKRGPRAQILARGSGQKFLARNRGRDARRGEGPYRTAKIPRVVGTV